MSLVIYERKDHIVYLTMNRPEKQNALNSALFDELKEAWVRFRDDEDAWVAIISGAGKSFSVGLDLAEVAKGTRLDLFNSSALYHEVWKPTIAAMSGWAIAAGWYIGLECDIRIASEDAQMALREVQWGMPATGVDTLPRHVSLGLALELLFTAEPLGAQRAYEMGLVNRVVPKDQLLPTATAMAEKMCRHPPLALKAVKKYTYKSLWPGIHEVADLGRSIAAITTESEDAREGPRAFAEGRKPQYKGR